MPGHDVAIVGAGMAGLAAAERLTAAGLSVTMLEARDRIGGRAFTDSETLGVDFDQAAQWLHATAENELIPLVKALGFSVVPHWPRRRWYADGKLVEIAETRHRFEETVRAAQDVAVSTLFATESEAERLVAGLLCSIVSARDPHELSARDWQWMIDTGENCLVPEGLGNFVHRYGEPIVERIGLHLSAPVTAIHQDAGGVALKGDGFECRARSAIVTVPQGVLRDGTIVFEPSLPDWKQDAIDKIEMALLDKIGFYLPASDNPEDHGSVNIMLRPDGEVVTGFLWPNGLPIALVFVGSGFARKLEARGKDGMIAYGRQVLSDLLGPELAAQAGAADATRWLADPWARGAYSGARPGFAHLRHDLAKPVDRLFFAGEATETIWSAQLTGAWRSGRRAADEVLALLRP